MLGLGLSIPTNRLATPGGGGGGGGGAGITADTTQRSADDTNLTADFES